MYTLVLVRHGESEWNKENRFTGWTDVDLSTKGVDEAISCGKGLKEAGFLFDVAYTSVLKRAIRTLNFVLDELDMQWIPVRKEWRLNERHYGALQGLNKAETARKFGRGAGAHLAAELRHKTAGAQPGRSTVSRQRQAICRARSVGASLGGEPQGYDRAVYATLARRYCSRY